MRHFIKEVTKTGIVAKCGAPKAEKGTAWPTDVSCHECLHVMGYMAKLPLVTDLPPSRRVVRRGPSRRTAGADTAAGR